MCAVSVLGSAAAELAGAGLRLLPIKAGCKKPILIKGGTEMCNASSDAQTVAQWWANWPQANIGIACTRATGIVVIDIDTPAHGEDHGDGRATLAAWEDENGRLPETVATCTPTGGKHLYYRWPEGEPWPDQLPNPKAGIDLRSKGYALAPPSIHPGTGETYEWSVSPEDTDVTAADANVVAFVRACAPKPEPKTEGEGTGEQAIQPAYFELPEEVEEGCRDDTLFKYCCSLRQKGLERPQILTMAREYNRACCRPPIEPETVEEKVAQACKYRKGKTKKMSSLVRTIELMGSSPLMRDGLRYNTLDGQLWLVGDILPDGKPYMGPRRLTDGDVVALESMLTRVGGSYVHNGFQRALVQFADTCDRFNPFLNRVRQTRVKPIEGDPMHVMASFNGGPWELQFSWHGNLFHNYFHDCGREPVACDGDPYTMEVEKLLGRSIVARAKAADIWASGVTEAASLAKVEHVFIVQGEQGTGKTVFFDRLMFGDKLIYKEGLGSLEGYAQKDTLLGIRGKLLVLDDEFRSFGKATVGDIKSFVSCQTDEYRDPFGKKSKPNIRTAVFAATTNDAAMLRDPTGERRFLPIACDHPFNNVCKWLYPDGEEDGYPSVFHFDRQCDKHIRVWWAQALQDFERDEKAGFRSLLLPAYVRDELQAMQSRYKLEDEDETDIRSWIAQGIESGYLREGEPISVRRAAIEGLGMTSKEWSIEKRKAGGLAVKITTILDHIGLLERGDGATQWICVTEPGREPDPRNHQARKWWAVRTE